VSRAGKYAGDLYVATDRHNLARKTYHLAYTASLSQGVRMNPIEPVAPELLSLIRPRKLVTAIKKSQQNPHYQSKLTETYSMPVVESMLSGKHPQNHFQVVGSPLHLCANVVRDLANVNSDLQDQYLGLCGRVRIS
jgi:hypothetical protein